MIVRHAIAFAALFALAAIPGQVRAAEKAKDEEAALAGQARALKVNEIERGLWIAVEASPIAHLDWVTTIPPKNIPRQLLPDDVGGGLRMGTRIGFDIFGLLSIDGYATSHFRDKRIRRGRSFTGDLSDFNLGLGLRLMPVTLFKRLSFTGRIGLGIAGLFPGEVARANANPNCIPPPAGGEPLDINPLCLALPGIKTPSNPIGFVPFPAQVLAVSPSTEIMLGLEYFTHLRHFSVGADLVTGGILWPLSIHVGIVPHVKYTF